MSLPVFLTEPGGLQNLGPGDCYTLSGPEARHAAGVMRIRVGDNIQVVDGAGTRMSAEVIRIDNGASLVLEVGTVDHEPASTPHLLLAQGLAKGGRDELAIEAATEVGAAAVLPWQADRCVSRWRGPKVGKGAEKWRQTVLAATKQSRRAHLPQVHELHDTPDLVAAVGAAVLAGDVVLVAHEDAATALSEALQGASPERVWLLVGPEGGISAEEVTQLRQAGARPVTLGPHVLRASTAGPVGLALVREQFHPC